MEKENKKSEWKQQYQKRKGYFKEYYQKHKDVMDTNNRKNAKKYREAYKSFREGKNTELEKIVKLEEENKKLKEDVDFFRQCYLDLKKLCEEEGFLLSNEEVIKMLNLDEIK